MTGASAARAQSSFSTIRATPAILMLPEKDWHVTRAIGVLASLDHEGAAPAFGGGTSLSKAWGLIRRFSEDIDFKVTMPPVSRNRARRARGDYRDRIVAALAASGFDLMGEVSKRDENRFFSAAFLFPSLFAAGRGLRPHIRVEMNLAPPALPATTRPIGSLIAAAQGQAPEVAAFLAVDPVETAADKMSALAWRVHARRRGEPNDDPTIIRHLQDLAALRHSVEATPEFVRLVRAALAADEGRGGGPFRWPRPCCSPECSNALPATRYGQRSTGISWTRYPLPPSMSASVSRRRSLRRGSWWTCFPGGRHHERQDRRTRCM